MHFLEPLTLIKSPCAIRTRIPSPREDPRRALGNRITTPRRTGGEADTLETLHRGIEPSTRGRARERDRRIHAVRTREIATLRALGFARTVVLLSVLLEVLALALVGGGMRRRAGVCSVQRIAGNHLQPVQRRRIPFRRHAAPDRRAPGLRPRPRIDRRPAACDPGRATVHRGRPAPRVRLRTPRRSPPRPCRCRCTSSPCRSPSSAGGACRAPASRCESLRSPPADGQARWRRRAD